MERWITPSVFQGTLAKDEYSFCHELGTAAAPRLQQHWKTFITRDDFVWLKEQGLQAVRIPVGYWLFGDQPPFIGNQHYLDQAMKWTAELNIQVIIGLHGLPGSQNGLDHSGREGRIEWTTSENIDLSLRSVERIAQTYGKLPNLIGIEVANEPKDTIPHATLMSYYENAYQRIRKHCSDQVAVIISDAYRFFDWQEDLLHPAFENVWLDTHLYQAFGKENERRDIHRHLLTVKQQWPEHLERVSEAHPVMVGEWSLGLPRRAFRGLDDRERDLAMQAFGRLQLEAFERARAWFFWTYKTEDMDGWSLRAAIQRDWLQLGY